MSIQDIYREAREVKEVEGGRWKADGMHGKSKNSTQIVGNKQGQRHSATA